MVDIEKSKAKKIFEKTYTDKATIKVYQKNIIRGLTKTELIILHSDIPCRLCFYNSRYTQVEQSVYGEFKNQIVLMISPDIDIPKNSIIEVTRNGITTKYSNSNSMKLITHQSVTLIEKETKS